ncbi:POU domain, class 6, transcription factor 2 isoform X2 [Bradysia coprophila]|uniref:POU domain, class 6, transcription factor 2 isoform X2 n=1 Tax=Bradysia coprophila TaxID=38358 RepID=UPI00187DD720|nr:POU domain, class 6, transcription factor 2 isoform X2 [Bradysia coprophila]
MTESGGRAPRQATNFTLSDINSFTTDSPRETYFKNASDESGCESDMAEGVEEAESNSGGDAIAMLGAAMPCETINPNIGALKREFEAYHSALATSTPVAAVSQIHPINLKSEDFDKERESSSCSPVPANVNNRGNLASSILNAEKMSPHHQEHHKSSTNTTGSVQTPMNGTMQDMVNLQKLQNLVSIQHSPLPSLASLQGLSGLSSTAGLNSPLNLSVGSASNLNPSQHSTGGGALGGSSQLPQLILASGQLIQGVQGAQLLIPTSQGITSQTTILMIPVNQLTNSNEQLVQTLAALNNSAASLNNIQMQSMQLPAQQSGSAAGGILNPNLFSSSVQQLVAAIQPDLFNQSKNQPASHHQFHSQHQTSEHCSSPHHSQNQTPGQASPIPHNHRVQTPKQSPPKGSSSSSILLSQFEKQINSSTSTQSHSTYCPTTNGHVQIPITSHLNINTRSHSPSTAAINSISRLTAANGELTITKTHGPTPSYSSTSSSSNHLANQHSSSMKMSPSSMHLSPTETDNSNADMLSDSPDEPTINQTNCNVVDGIDLDEIKEFAKAFKLRRLSLGLTQTQVGQALSVTEGPAYSQSAICRFEKLDITPKSAQKIKPVLERWMKEAEESHWNRYKSGQNHLTDFIGVEPSKKRKRRTSFTPQALELLNAHFERNTHPSGTEITGLAHQLGYEREVIRIWFCNKRQALKNTVRMMSKGMV